MTLEDRLAEGMREVAAGYHVDRDLIAGARAGNRRRAARRWAGAAAAVVAVVGFGVATTDSAPDRLTSVADQPLDHTLRTKGPYILHLTTRVSGSEADRSSEKWYDPVTEAHVDVNGGGPGIDVGYHLRTSMRGVCVDYNEHTWWTCAPETITIPAATPDGMRKWLKTVKRERVGEERINGVDTIHSRRSDATGERLDVWVTADSDVLVRMVTTGGKEQPRIGTVRTDYEWFDRTPAARARVELTPPAGWPSQEPSK